MNAVTKHEAADPFAMWREAVAARKPVDAPKGVVACGYYRARDGECIAFLPAGDIFTVWRSSNKPAPIHEDAIVEMFSWVCMYPVSYDDVLKFGADGRWPDQVAPVEVAADLPPHERADAELTAQREAMAAWIKEVVAIDTQDKATKAGNFADAFAKLEKASDEARKVEKEPHLIASREVDAKWQPIVKRAADLKAWAKKSTEPFLIAERARIAAEEKAVAEARAKAAREAEEARRSAEAANLPPPVDLPEVFQPAPAPAKAKAGKVHLRQVTKHEIVNMRAVLLFLADMNSHSGDLTAAIQISVNRMRSAGVEVPGVKTKIVEVAA